MKPKCRTCLWCKKPVKLKYCNPKHRTLYIHFRLGFNEEMFYLKKAPKTRDSKAYKKVINILTNTS